MVFQHVRFAAKIVQPCRSISQSAFTNSGTISKVARPATQLFLVVDLELVGEQTGQGVQCLLGILPFGREDEFGSLRSG